MSMSEGLRVTLTTRPPPLPVGTGKGHGNHHALIPLDHDAPPSPTAPLGRGDFDFAKRLKRMSLSEEDGTMATNHLHQQQQQQQQQQQPGVGQLILSILAMLPTDNLVEKRVLPRVIDKLYTLEDQSTAGGDLQRAELCRAVIAAANGRDPAVVGFVDAVFRSVWAAFRTADHGAQTGKRARNLCTALQSSCEPRRWRGQWQQAVAALLPAAPEASPDHPVLAVVIDAVADATVRVRVQTVLDTIAKHQTHQPTTAGLVAAPEAVVRLLVLHVIGSEIKILEKLLASAPGRSAGSAEHGSVRQLREHTLAVLSCLLQTQQELVFRFGRLLEDGVLAFLRSSRGRDAGNDAQPHSAEQPQPMGDTGHSGQDGPRPPRVQRNDLLHHLMGQRALVEAWLGCVSSAEARLSSPDPQLSVAQACKLMGTCMHHFIKVRANHATRSAQLGRRLASTPASKGLHGKTLLGRCSELLDIMAAPAPAPAPARKITFL